MKKTNQIHSIEQIKKLNIFFEKLISSEVSKTSIAYGQFLMTNLEKIKNDLQQLTIENINFNEKKNVDIIFTFWTHLLFIIKYGKLNITMKIIFKIIFDLISIEYFHKISLTILQINLNEQEFSIYQVYIILCRETYFLTTKLFKEFIIGIIKEEEFLQLKNTSENEIFSSMYNKIQKKIPEKIENEILKIITLLSVIDKEILNEINELIEITINQSTTIQHFNPHFLLDYLPTTKIERNGSIEKIIPLIVLFENKFLFMIRFFPEWLYQMKQINISNEKIIRSCEYFEYKSWIFKSMGKIMRSNKPIKDVSYLIECFKSLLKENDITNLNELIFIIKTNTNIFDIKQMNRMSKMIEIVMNFYINLHSQSVCIFDDTFKIHDFVQIIEMSISAEHIESLLRLLGLLYSILPYFIGNSRLFLIHDYLLNQRFTYFFFHWFDMIRNAYFHIILYRSIFVKQNHLISNKLNENEKLEYSKRKNNFYDPHQQDIKINTFIMNRIEMYTNIIHSFDINKIELTERKMVLVFKEFEIVKKKFDDWLKSKQSHLTIPSIVTEINITEE